ncbi:MAG: Lrp/AsnC family transcriptional regulator [Candidatus Heimdallarchaeota archaeon]
MPTYMKNYGQNITKYLEVLTDSMSAIDDVDLKILEYFTRDPRVRASELSVALGISRETLRSRIRNLINQDILRGFVTVMDFRGLGFNVTTLFLFKTNPREPWLLEQIKILPNCDFIAGITGDFSLLSRFRIRNEKAFGKVMYEIDSLMAKSGSRMYRVIRVVDIFKENGSIVEKIPNRIVDERDLAILKQLVYQRCSKNRYSPLSSLQLASKVNLSQPTVYKRLQRLENDRIILGFSVDVNWARVGSDRIGFVVQLKVDFDKISEVASFIAGFSEVSSLYRTTEEYPLLALIQVQKVADFTRFLLKCYEIPSVEDTNSLLLLDVPLERSPAFLLETIYKTPL